MDTLSDDEVAAIQAVLLMMAHEGAQVSVMTVREAWPDPSPWRWAPIG